MSTIPIVFSGAIYKCASVFNTPSKGIRNATLLLLSLFVLSGCWEQETVIAIESDGSGKIEQTIIISERAVVGFSDVDEGNPPFPLEREELLKAIGDTLQGVVIDEEERADGSHKITLSGTFTSASAFFASEFAVKSLGLTFEKGPDDEILLSWNHDNSSENMGPELGLNELYGLLHGMYRRLRITKGDEELLDWQFDLRNRNGLETTRKWLAAHNDNPQKVISSESLGGWSWEDFARQKEIAKAVSTAQAVVLTEAEGDFQLEPRSISLRRNRYFENPQHDGASLSVSLNLIAEGNENLFYYPIQITSAADNTGHDLTPQSNQMRTTPSMIYPNNARVSLNLPGPTPEATAIANLTGYLPLILHTEIETVTVDRIDPDAETTGSESLDAIGFRFVEGRANELKFSAQAETNFFKSVTVVTPTGHRISPQGSSSYSRSDIRQFTYNIPVNIPEGSSVEFEIRLKETIVNVPIAFEDLPLP